MSSKNVKLYNADKDYLLPNTSIEMVDNLETELDAKLSTDVDNITDEGKKIISSYAFPSTTSISISIGSSGSSYIAPVDGWFTCLGTSTVSGSRAEFYIVGGVGTKIQSPSNNNTLRWFLPIAKGQEMFIWYSNGMTLSEIFFYYSGGYALG